MKHEQWRAAVEAYLACVTYVDHEIGRLLDALDNSPFGDNTVIVLWSDHGWHLGEKQHWGKWTGWERSTKVPLIIVPPKKLADRFAAAGSRCDQPVGLIDLYPTLTELCGVAAPDKLDGQSLVPLLREPNVQHGPSRRHDVRSGQCHRSARNAGATSATPTARRNSTTIGPIPTNGTILPARKNTSSERSRSAECYRRAHGDCLAMKTA